MKAFKRILSLVCILATLVLLIQAPVANASTDIIFNEEYNDVIDEYSERKYVFKLNNRTELTFDLESEYPMDITIELYDSSYGYFNDYSEYYGKTSFFKTLKLNKGKYRVTLECSEDAFYDEYEECDCCWDCEYWSYGDDCYCDCSDCLAYQEIDDTNEFTFQILADKAKKVRLNKNKITLKPGKTKSLTIQTTPSLAYIEDLYWWSSNEAVAKVNQQGKVTAKGWGKATIYAEAGSKTAKCTVIVKTNKTIQIHVGSTLNLPKINGQKQSGWKSSNTYIATTSSTVTGKNSGTTTVYKKIGGVTYTCKIKVINPYTLLSKGKTKIKNDLYYPSSFTPQTAWRGYWYDGDAVVVLKFRGKTLGGWMVTKYAVIWYSGSNVKYSFWDYMPSSSNFSKKVKL